MATYEVLCGNCGRSMLFEKAQPMDAPGELSAFCSTKCSRDFMVEQWGPFQAAGIAKIVEVSCGCIACVFGTDGDGSTMPWLLCDYARPDDDDAGSMDRTRWRDHSADVHREAVEIARNAKI